MASPIPRRVDFSDGIPVGVRAFLIRGQGRMLNLSAMGAYVTTAMHLLPQARVRLQIVLREEKRWVETDAVVVWENRGTTRQCGGLPPGYGLRFVDTPEETRFAIDGLLGGARAQPAASVRTENAAASGPPREEEPEGPPYPLRRELVAKLVPARVPGIYVLSYDRSQETRVGRADADLRSALSSYEGEYAYFYFEVLEDDDERWLRECELYHRLGGDRRQLDNTAHPSPLPGIDGGCPLCVPAKLR